MQNNDLKDRLREFRIMCGLSQQQVAKLLMIHRSTYSYYELGKTEPSLDNICMLAKIFGVTLNQLMGMESGSQTVVRDDAYSKDAMRIGDLTREEKMLVMRYRLLTKSQRHELLSVMLTADDLQPDDDEDEEE